MSRLEAQIAELSSLLKAALPPSPVTDIPPTFLDIAKSPTRGRPEAKIIVVEFSDFECPFCGRHAAGAYREIQAKFVDTGKIRYVFRHLPLEQLHPNAHKAAEAAECAGDQQRFWEFHDRLFANQRALTSADLVSHARTERLDVPQFEACLFEGRRREKVAADLADAKRLGLTGTPVFIFGEIQRDGSVTATRKIVGSHPFHVFDAVLNDLLAASSQRAAAAPVK